MMASKTHRGCGSSRREGAAAKDFTDLLHQFESVEVKGKAILRCSIEETECSAVNLPCTNRIVQEADGYRGAAIQTDAKGRKDLKVGKPKKRKRCFNNDRDGDNGNDRSVAQCADDTKTTESRGKPDPQCASATT